MKAGHGLGCPRSVALAWSRPGTHGGSHGLPAGGHLSAA